ncbi:MAG: hypothetical protein CFR70_14440 [Rhodocyclaceae bacterium]|nr:MAG: hypothetical protein CFR70_14440 [Rhodocyclaceae bacterium]
MEDEISGEAQFWRCFASTWSLRKDEVFEELVARLSAMGIEPMGAMDKVPSLVEKRVWAPEGNDSEPEVQSDPVAVVLEQAVAESKVTVDTDTDLMTLWEQALDN